MPIQPDKSIHDDQPEIRGDVSIRPEGPPTWPIRDAAVENAVRRALADGSWGKYHGLHCQALSQRLSEMHNQEHVALTCSGTAAVELALRGLRIGEGDEVILSAYDFEGNFKNVLAVGAKPVLVDVDPLTCQLDVTQLDSALSPQTKAIIASHLHGGVVEMPAVRAFADQHGIAVIEDAAQMPGATIQGRIAGTWGDIGILSFGGSKLLTAGRGGALITSDAAISQRIRVHSFRGNDAYPLSELQAVVLLPQFDRLAERRAIRTASVLQLLEFLRDISGLRCLSAPSKRRAGELNPNFSTAVATHPDFYKLGFWYDDSHFKNLSRDDFACAMRAAGIALDSGFRAAHRIHSRSRFRAVGDLPIASHADRSILVLHHPVLLDSTADLANIAASIKSVVESAATS